MTAPNEARHWYAAGATQTTDLGEGLAYLQASALATQTRQHCEDRPPRRTLAAQPSPAPGRPARRRRALPAGPHRTPGGRALGCADRARDEPDGDLVSRAVTRAASALVGLIFAGMVALTLWGWLG